MYEQRYPLLQWRLHESEVIINSDFYKQEVLISLYNSVLFSPLDYCGLNTEPGWPRLRNVTAMIERV